MDEWYGGTFLETKELWSLANSKKQGQPQGSWPPTSTPVGVIQIGHTRELPRELPTFFMIKALKNAILFSGC